MSQPSDEEMSRPLVTMTKDQLSEALADLERLALDGGLSVDDLMDLYNDRIEALDEEE